MIPAFPKIHAYGHRNNANILNGEIEVTEKIDGSQFSFGKIDDQLFVRSKGRHFNKTTDSDALFNKGVAFAVSVQNLVPDGWVFHGETLCKPRHNKLAYDRTPRNNFMLYATRNLETGKILNWSDMSNWADTLGCEVVPLLYKGEDIGSIDDIMRLMDSNSILGNVKMEGVVVRNYTPVKIGDEMLPFTQAKIVSDDFKEVMGVKITSKDKVRGLFEAYQTMPRWEKAIQHLRENGELEDSPRDIGKIMAEINRDVEGECGDEVKELLWGLFRKDFLKVVTNGFPQWYKYELMNAASKGDSK